MLECHVVRDLLPTYIDGLASKETEADVLEHIQECSKCNELLEQMKAPIQNISIEKPSKEIDYLKKIKARITKKFCIGIATIICIFAILTYMFAIGSPVEKADLQYTLREDQGGWIIDFELKNGRSLSMRQERISEAGSLKVKEVIFRPFEVLQLPFDDEQVKCSFGYSITDEQGLVDKQKSQQIRIVIKFADGEVEVKPADLIK